MAYEYNNDNVVREGDNLEKRLPMVEREFRRGDKVRVDVDREVRIMDDNGSIISRVERKTQFLIIDHVSDSYDKFSVKVAFEGDKFKKEVSPLYVAWYYVWDVTGYYGNIFD